MRLCNAAKDRRRRWWTPLAIGAVALGVSSVVGTSAGATPATPGEPHATTVPRVLSVHPDVVRGKGGGRIVVDGSGFTPDTSVTIGGRHAVVLSVRNSDSLVAVAPAGIGTEVVRAITPAGTSAANSRSVLRFVTRVLVVGDSLGIDLGWGFTAALDSRYDLTSVDLAVESSGLVRTDYYNWFAHLRADIATTHPDVVETLFGTNDQQALVTGGGPVEPGTTTWNRVYSSRVKQVASIVHGAGLRLVWIGLPRMGPQSVLGWPYVEDVIGVDRAALQGLPGVTFVDTWPLFTTSAGTYTPYVELAPRVWALGHAGDGTHLTPDGATAIDARGMVALRRLLTRF